MTHLTAGDKAPNFSGKDQNEETVSLADFKGKKLVLYFYPKDNTPGCTVEACNFRDNYQTLLQAGYAVVGVSADSAKKHQNFIKKFDLPFPLIADEDRSIIDAYGVWGKKKFMGREFDGIHRETFVIDEQGTIEKVITNVKNKEAAAQILE
jgi:peroxiredoxin Q/BCP